MAIDPNDFERAAGKVIADLGDNPNYQFLNEEDSNERIKGAYEQLIRTAPPIITQTDRILYRWIWKCFKSDPEKSTDANYVRQLTTLHFLDKATLKHEGFPTTLELYELVMEEEKLYQTRINFLNHYFRIYGTDRLSLAIEAASLFIDYDEVLNLICLYRLIHKLRGSNPSREEMALNLLVAASLFDTVRLECLAEEGNE
jgi:hypothetical protein